MSNSFIMIRVFKQILIFEAANSATHQLDEPNLSSLSRYHSPPHFPTSPHPRQLPIDFVPTCPVVFPITRFERNRTGTRRHSACRSEWLPKVQSRCGIEKFLWRRIRPWNSALWNRSRPGVKGDPGESYLLTTVR